MLSSVLHVSLEEVIDSISLMCEDMLRAVAKALIGRLVKVSGFVMQGFLRPFNNPCCN